jgi:phosphate starvation-inducible PhoH-like protein
MERKIKIKSLAEAQALFGPNDENIKSIEKEFKVKLTLRGDYLKLTGSINNIEKAKNFILEFIKEAESCQTSVVTRGDLYNRMKNSSKEKQDFDRFEPKMLGARSIKAQAIGPKTKGQKEYFEAIKSHDIVFGIGPAGTGKTYLAMACAVESLKAGEVRRIILTRPAIEAGESLGYLPGDMYEKISPYLRPLYDALYDMMEAERIEKYLETGIIEVAPLAYM